VRPAITIRPLHDSADFAACIDLQRRTWGARFRELVPVSLLKVTQRMGGVVSGAFAPTGELVGFVYGMTGVIEGRVIHWSHMLAVRPDARNQGIGRRLKLHQRDLLRVLGVDEMRWTFDPLVARNGHLNLNVLGADVIDYVTDMYEETGSNLHTFGTDRLVVSWPVATAPVGLPANAQPASTPAASSALEDMPLANRAPAPVAAAPDPGEPWGEPALRVEVPSDVEALAASALPLACAWRTSTRAAFLGALARGYRVTGFCGSQDTRSFYVVRKAVPR
jgi:chorismate synthase